MNKSTKKCIQRDVNGLPGLHEKMMRPNAAILQELAVIAFLSIIFFLLIANLDNTPLWQDEAESALNALTIDGNNILPRGVIKEDLPMHECTLYFPSEDDPMYAYHPTAYYYSPYVTVHGWLPYYFIRLGIYLFGKNEYGPRCFSVVFFVLFLFTFYKILRRYHGYIISLLPVIYLALMPNMLTYAMQARYFSLMLFALSLSLLLFLKYLEDNRAIFCVLFYVSVVLLYYTYMQLYFLTLAVYFALMVWKQRTHLLPFVFGFIASMICIMPHVVLTKVYKLGSVIPKQSNWGKVSWNYLHVVLNNNTCLIAFFLVFLALLLFFVIWNKFSGWKPVPINSLDAIVALMVLLGYPTISFMTPQMAFYPRMLVPLVPFIVYGAIRVPFLLFDVFHKRVITSVAGILVFAYMVFNPYNVNFSLSQVKHLFQGKFMPCHIRLTDSRWVPYVIDYIKSRNVEDPLILTSFEQFVFSYYSDFDAQLLWPVKKKFIDTTTRNLFIVLERDRLLDKHCEIYYPNDTDDVLCEKGNRNYDDRISKCKKTAIGGVTVYESVPQPNDSENVI